MARRKSYPVFVALALSGLFTVVLLRAERLEHQSLLLGAFVVLASAWLLLRVVLAYVSVPVSDRVPDLSVSVVVPVYNEDPELFRSALASIAGQTHSPSRVWIVDDGSSDSDCFSIAESWAEQYPDLDVRVRRLPTNRGKRHAQAEAFRRDSEVDVFVTSDSDTILEPNAIEECLKPFSDERVQGVSALVVGNNWKRNLLTRVVDLEFVNNFLVGRAAMGRLGSVLVTCGSLAAYRGGVCRDQLESYLGETFLGASVRNGDDRKLTQFALQKGRVVFQETAVAHAALPETLSHLVRQRFRWFTSFYRGTCWMLRNMSPRRMAFWLTVCHAGMFLAESALILAGLLYATRIDWSLAILGVYVYTAPLSYLRSLRYVTFSRSGMSGPEQARVFLLAPLVTVLYLLVLIPLRYIAILGVRSKRWRTRDRVEVSLAQRPKERALGSRI